MPISVTTDGAPGLIKAMRACFPKSLPIRCWVHGLRNVLCKVPEDAQAEIKAELHAIRDALTFDRGRELAGQFIRAYGKIYPSTVACFQEDLEARLNHVKLPLRHRKKVRTTNLAERGFEEQRRRTKIIPRFFSEKACLKLVFASLWRASLNWRGIRVYSRELAVFDELAVQLRIRKAITGRQVHPAKGLLLAA